MDKKKDKKLWAQLKKESWKEGVNVILQINQSENMLSSKSSQ